MNDIIISVRDLCKCFGDFVAVDHITFDVKRGEIFGFLGANGAGNSHAYALRVELSDIGAWNGCRVRCDDAGRGDKEAYRLYESEIFVVR